MKVHPKHKINEPFFQYVLLFFLTFHLKFIENPFPQVQNFISTRRIFRRATDLQLILSFSLSLSLSSFHQHVPTKNEVFGYDRTIVVSIFTMSRFCDYETLCGVP